MSKEPTTIPNLKMKTIILIIMTAPAMSFANAVNTCVHTKAEHAAEERRLREAMSQEPTAIPNIKVKVMILIIIIAPAMSFANAVSTCVPTGQEGRARGKRSTAEGDATRGAPQQFQIILSIRIITLVMSTVHVMNSNNPNNSNPNNNNPNNNNNSHLSMR